MRFLASAITAMMVLALGASPSPAVAQEKAPAPAPPAPSEAAVTSEVVVLHATNDGTGIDPKIGKMPELGKPPFSAYNSYKLLDRLKISLQKGKPTTTKLPNGSVLMVSLKDVVAAKKQDEPKRFVISASIQKPGGNTFLPLLEVNAKAGENFFVAGQQHLGGVLVLGVKVAP
ncbi:hypothetical protein [Sorangium cellulosum]|uniref:Secreted protein n=1 Tax=Sorangium cellulosum TaxID=56 RepID=A0A150QBV7_SORCE|nr:hypothetical protein [Sorangium cellulosum]KYF65455.1 hypothetical protein BE15_09910 [Sorangium cellulosum]